MSQFPWPKPSPDEPAMLTRLRAGAYDQELSAVREAERLKRLRKPIQSRMLRLVIWCESGTCRVGRVYSTKGHYLLELTMPESTGFPERLRTKGMKNGILRHFSASWLDTPDPKTLSFTCKCQNATSRHLAADLVLAAAQSRVRNTSVAALLAG